MLVGVGVVGVSDSRQFNARIPADLKRLIDADPRNNQEVAKTALWREFGGTRQSAIETRIEHKDRRIAQIESEIEDLQEELQQEKSEREALLDQLDEMQSEDEAYASACDDLLDRVEHGDLNRLVPALCEDVANDYGKDASTVFEDCKERALEQERELLNSDFMSPTEANNLRPSEHVPITEAWGGDDE